MRYFAGPFIGEFGWELCYWQGWLRKIKKDFLQKDELIICSYPGRYPLYEFADKFLELPQWFLNKKYSQRGYLLDFNQNNFLEVKKDLIDLLDYYKNYLKEQKTNFIFNYPQKKGGNFFGKALNFIKCKNYYDINDFLKNCNTNSGNLISETLFDHVMNSDDPEFYSGKYQSPYNRNDIQTWKILSPTHIGINIRDKILAKYNDTNKKNIFTLFPRKRSIRRPDKNWAEKNWLDFINKLIEKFDPIIVLCGSPDGAYFAEMQNTKNVINIIKTESSVSLDLQLAFLKVSKVAIHGRSGSCYLSMLANCKTFMAGPKKDTQRICKHDNPLNSDICYFTDYGIDPPVEKFFDKFMEYLKK